MRHPRGSWLARVDAAGGKYGYFSDPLGSTALVLGPNGTKQELDYYPFGGERVITSTLENHYKFTGMERDTETGLDHTQFRQYASNLGRWHYGCAVRSPINADAISG